MSARSIFEFAAALFIVFGAFFCGFLAGADAARASPPPNAFDLPKLCERHDSRVLITTNTYIYRVECRPRALPLRLIGGVVSQLPAQ